MSAAEAVRAGVLAALREELGARVNRVIDGEAAVASVPFVQLRGVTASDWGTKDRAGRELRVSIAVHDAGDGAARCAALAGMVEAAVEGLARDLADGWRVASVALVRSAVLAEGAGRWAALVDYRVRVLAAD